MTPLQTLKDFANSCHQQPCSTAPIHAIQSEDISSVPSVATTAVVDICQLDNGTIDDDLVVAICSLAAANPHTCDICGTIDHVIAACPRLQKMMSDPARAHCIVNAIQQGCTSRGGSTTNLMVLTSSLTLTYVQARAHTPPMSNWSATIWQTQDNDTNYDVGLALFTDEEGSIGEDFQ